MNNVNTESLGSVKISDEVIAVCAAEAVLKTDGVASLWGGITDTISKNFLGKEPVSKGIKVSQGDDSITLDIYIVAKYGTKIPDMAWDIQDNVKTSVESMTDIKVAAVNIHVNGVFLPEEGETDDKN